MTSFVGRRHELDAARACLEQSRLVSLVGPGGVGKTRVAEELVDRTARVFRDGSAWIDLAPIREPDAVPSAAAVALGVTDQSSKPVADKLTDRVRGRHILIVIDNCEHLLTPVVELVSTLLAAAPECRIVTTSREPLRVAGEKIYDLPPLALPDPSGHYLAAEVAHFEAVSLLVERAQSVVADFALTDANAVAVVQLCRRLDGFHSLSNSPPRNCARSLPPSSSNDSTAASPCSRVAIGTHFLASRRCVRSSTGATNYVPAPNVHSGPDCRSSPVGPTWMPWSRCAGSATSHQATSSTCWTG